MNNTPNEWKAIGLLIAFLFVIGIWNQKTYKLSLLLGVAAVAILINTGIQRRKAGA